MSKHPKRWTSQRSTDTKREEGSYVSNEEIPKPP